MLGSENQVSENQVSEKKKKRIIKKKVCTPSEQTITQIPESPNSTKETDKNIELKNYTEEPWDIIGSYFEGKHLRQLVRHQIESYNDFVSYQIQRTISMFNPVNVCSDQDFVKDAGKHSLDIQVTFDKFSVYHPQIHENNGATKIMFPHEARLRNFTYASNMTVDMNVKYTIRSGIKLESEQILYKVFPGINIGKLPIMLKSCICVLEQYKKVLYSRIEGLEMYLLQH
jgi:DNA-directed RNA polymerase II subunit RPB2